MDGIWLYRSESGDLRASVSGLCICVYMCVYVCIPRPVYVYYMGVCMAYVHGAWCMCSPVYVYGCVHGVYAMVYGCSPSNSAVRTPEKYS